MTDSPITLAVPMGDPAGIGPEICVKAFSVGGLPPGARVVVVGSAAVLRRAAGWCTPAVEVLPVGSLDELPPPSSSGDPAGAPDDPAGGVRGPRVLPVLDLDAEERPDLDHLPVGRITAAAGRLAYRAIERGVDLARAGAVDALVTAPIHKESLRAAGVEHVGHTEILAALTGSGDPLTMFEVHDLRVFFLSRHVSLRAACDLVTRENLLRFVHRSHRAMQDLGFPRPRLAVAGLNPHCGEHGLFGDEEGVAVEPAVEEARAAGVDVVGPIGADSVFHQCLQGRFDAVLSLYHDQGHIATKTLDFERTVSVTLGLPFLRTSVDHGTAFDIAGTGEASAMSLMEALTVAARHLRGRANRTG